MVGATLALARSLLQALPAARLTWDLSLKTVHTTVLLKVVVALRR